MTPAKKGRERERGKESTMWFEVVFKFSLPEHPRIPTTWSFFANLDWPMMIFCQRVARMTGYNLRDLSFKAGRNGNHCILDTGDTHPLFEENGVTAEDNTVEVSVSQAEIDMVG